MPKKLGAGEASSGQEEAEGLSRGRFLGGMRPVF